MLHQPLPLRLIAQSVRQSLGGASRPEDYLLPSGDPGLYGPESLVWRVHAEFLPMMIGGLASLLLQALHPGALAGVWDHSTFREDLTGRLGRTAKFVAMTTFGPTDGAEAVVQKIRRIHDQVVGVDEFGRPYAANDPQLLEWVQLTETRSFWLAWQWLGLADQHWSADQYAGEMRELGLRLGCSPDLPATWPGLEGRLAERAHELRCTARTREVIRLLEDFPVPIQQRLLFKAMLAAAFETLPDWALQMMGRRRANVFQVLAMRALLLPAHRVLSVALWEGSVAQMAWTRVGQPAR